MLNLKWSQFSGAFNEVTKITGQEWKSIASNSIRHAAIGAGIGAVGNGALAAARGESVGQGVIHGALTGGVIGLGVGAWKNGVGDAAVRGWKGIENGVGVGRATRGISPTMLTGASHPALAGASPTMLTGSSPVGLLEMKTRSGFNNLRLGSDYNTAKNWTSANMRAGTAPAAAVKPWMARAADDSEIAFSNTLKDFNRGESLGFLQDKYESTTLAAIRAGKYGA